MASAGDRCVDRASNVWGAPVGRALVSGDGRADHPARDASGRQPTRAERACAPDDASLWQPAKCVVVALRLAHNGLRSSLSAGSAAGLDGLCALPHLQALSLSGHGEALSGALPQAVGVGGRDGCLPSLRLLDVSHNALSGQLPLWATPQTSAVVRLDLAGNELTYEEELPWMVHCFDKDVACTGVPPQSCRAFGTSWEVEGSVGRSCVQCMLSPPWPAVMLVLMLLAFTVLGGAYAWMLMRRPLALKHLSSTIAIVIAHLQTLTILAHLRLAWPASSKRVFSLVVVNGLQLEAARPECLLNAHFNSAANGTATTASDVPYFYLFAAARVVLPLVAILLLSSCRWLLQLTFKRQVDAVSKWRKRRMVTRRTSDKFAARLDRLELLETIVFSLVLVTSWRACGDLIYARNTGSDSGTRALAYSGCLLAIALLLVQAATLGRYLLNYRQAMAQQREDRPCCSQWSSLSTQRLQYRLRCTPRRCTPRRCTPRRCTPRRCTTTTCLPAPLPPHF